MGSMYEPRETRHRVLIVDNEAIIRTLLRFFFEREGYEIETAENGAEALEHFEAGRFHCVMLAYYIPVMNGLEVASAMHRRDSNVPIMLMSASAHTLAHMDVAAVGITRIFAKPFDLNELSEWLNSLPLHT